jgi:regulator of replication initiation timing
MIRIPLPLYAASSAVAITTLSTVIFKQHQEINLLHENFWKMEQLSQDADNRWKKATKDNDALFMQNRDLRTRLDAVNAQIYALRDAWRVAQQNELSQLPSQGFHKGVKWGDR